jgi:hypothetical protein
MEPGREFTVACCVAARPGGGERSQLCLGSSPAKCVSRLACSRKGPSDPTGRLKMTPGFNMVAATTSGSSLSFATPRWKRLLFAPQAFQAGLHRRRGDPDANQLRASPRAKSNPLGILISRGAFPQRCRVCITWPLSPWPQLLAGAFSFWWATQAPRRCC